MKFSPKWLCVFSRAAHTLRQSKLQIRTFYAFGHKKHWMLVCPVIGRIQIILPQYLARLITVHYRHFRIFCLIESKFHTPVENMLRLFDKFKSFISHVVPLT